jgi:hypothetical protein
MTGAILSRSGWFVEAITCPGQIDPHRDNIHMGTVESDETCRFGQVQMPPGILDGIISRGFVRELP